VLNFARLGAGKLELRLADVGVGELLGEMGAVVEPMVQAKGLSFVTDPCEPRVHARGDKDRVAQVLLNLLSNAVKCTAPGGQVRMWAEADASSVRIHVRDTGCGIAREKQEVIFDPFVQLTPGGVLAEGVGLGLSISRELARAMQGELSVESAPGQGATFTLTLPHARRVAPQKIVEAPTWQGQDEVPSG
jgi:signal transduction histidine kinase